MNRENILRAVAICNEQKVEKVFHAGDIVSPKSAELFKDLDASMVLTFGNCDIYREEIIEILGTKAEICDEIYYGSFCGKKILMLHKPEYYLLDVSGKADLIIYGHTHRLDIRNLGSSLLINPGELVGRRYGKATMVIYDFEKSAPEIIELKNEVKK